MERGIVMSNYYDYREVKVMIAHKLMSMDSWKVYGYHEDRSDSMTDYYDPANWGGVAEKNGYILCVNVYGAAEPREIRKYNYTAFTYDKNIADKIAKLEAMTVERGASEAEETSARLSIERLRRKAEDATENKEKYIVTGTIPGHMAHPPKMNWHIEKDGVIIAKGNGILKYSKVYNYYNYPHYMEDLDSYKTDKEAYAEKHTQDLIYHRYYSNEEDARKNTERYIEEMENDIKLMDQFEKWINKIDTTCGSLIGKGDGTVYEKVTVTEYKIELKPVETASGEVKEGQLFILKSNFNYGRFKGFVYRIHETEYNGKKTYHAYKLNGKLTKECKGQAKQSNYWFIGTKESDSLTRWIEKGDIAWCELQEVKTPYEVEKVVKKTIKAESGQETPTEIPKQQEKVSLDNYAYEIVEDIDTRTNDKIWLVKIKQQLSREEYLQVNKYIRSISGYYSRYKKAFLFRQDPTQILKGENLDGKEESTDCTIENEVPKETLHYNITEDIHTKTGDKIWIVKPEKELNKVDFAEVKRKFAVLNGFYSSFKRGFIFKYDPTEVLHTG